MRAIKAKHCLLAAGLALLCSERAFPIGVVGNGAQVGDGVEGFTAKLPADFANVQLNSDRSAQLVSVYSGFSMAARFGDEGLLQISASPLSSAYPELLGRDKAQMEGYLASNFGLSLTTIPGPACATLLFGENSVGYMGVAQWGGGHGYVLTVEKSNPDSGKQAILEIMNSTQLTSPCSP